jgi:hypothetical protein
VLAGQRRFVFLFLTLLLLGASDLGGRLLFSLTTGYLRQQAGELQAHMKILVAFLPSSYSGKIAVIRVESVHIFCLILS